MSLNETAAFVSVVDHGGYAAAGRELRVPRSTLSRQIRRLEERLGVRLLHRTTRKLGLTDAGKHYYEQCRDAVDAITRAERSAVEHAAEPAGRVRVSSVNLSTIDWMLDGLAEFHARYPNIELELEFSNRRVDLIEEGFDVALRGGRMHDSTLVARKLVDTKLLVCAAPNYLERRGTPHTPEDLRHHDGIVLGSLWTGTGLRARGPRGLVELPVRASVVSNDLAVVCGLLVRGTGIGLMENGLAATHLRAGRLVQVLPDYGMHHDGGFYIVYPSRVHVPARVRAFVDFMIAHCRENNPLVEHGSPA